jgi:fibronectin type 3 domain-containing protein
MATPATPTNFNLTQANGQVLAQWAQAAGATSYVLQRSTDNITYTTIATVAALSYVDTTALLQTVYYYQVASFNGADTSLFTPPQTVIPTLTGQMSLAAVRLASLQRADRVNTNFVTLQELNSYVNQSYTELYDLLVTTYEDYYVAAPIQFTTNGNQFQYPLPNGVLTFLNPITQTNFVAPPFYKLMGVDLGLNNASNGYVTVNKFEFINRNRFVYPNTASTIYGVFNLQYRILGNVLEFIPTPSANQPIRVWYIPRLRELLQDTDILDGISGWTEYVITDVAIKILQKEESDVSVLAAQKLDLRKRIIDSGVNRDAGRPDKISDARGATSWGGYGGGDNGFNGSSGGW